jgi:endonuclease/exonuclease/phosphatase family metal-dependent hydrolase
MKKILKFILVCIGCLLVAGLLYGLYAIVFPWVTEFRPAARTIVFERSKDMEKTIPDTTFQILTWNIGYAGLGREMDFFYEGGTMVRPGRDQMQKYLDGIREVLGSNQSTDFLFIQEVDFRSKRSFKVNQYDAIGSILEGYHGVSAINYQSAFVPSPLREPMGRVKAGLATFSRMSPSSASRIATPGAYPWPMRLFMLKRCFLVSRYPLPEGKELVLFNIHNSAFDDAGDLRQLELELLRALALEEYSSGNFVVIGGDWNQNPPGWSSNKKGKYQVQDLWPIGADYMPPEWSWAFDPGQPTNRSVNKPFDRKETICTALDYFLVSPNVRAEQTEVLDMEFQFSDHQPVLMRFTLLR